MTEKPFDNHTPSCSITLFLLSVYNFVFAFLFVRNCDSLKNLLYSVPPSNTPSEECFSFQYLLAKVKNVCFSLSLLLVLRSLNYSYCFWTPCNLSVSFWHWDNQEWMQYCKHVITFSLIIQRLFLLLMHVENSWLNCCPVYL